MDEKVSQDRVKQERLLNFAGWLHENHRRAVRNPTTGLTEFRFTREILDDVKALDAYSLERGEAGERAMIRDVKELRAFGLGLDWDSRTQEWVSQATPLTDAESRALATASLLVFVDDGNQDPTGYHVPGAALSSEGAEVIVRFGPEVDALIEAIGDRRSVTVEHRMKQRKVDPWHVFVSDGRWYLVGFDHEARGRRVFGLDVVTGVQPHAGKNMYQIPLENFEQIALSATDPDSWVDADPIEVQLVVDPRFVGRAEAILSAEATGSVNGSGWVEMTCMTRNVDSFLHRLWGLRTRVVVTSPEEVRQRVISGLKAMI